MYLYKNTVYSLCMKRGGEAGNEPGNSVVDQARQEKGEKTMYRVMIVDDEKYIRRSIINRVEWGKYGLEVVGEAADGEEAYAGVQLYQPDIILVDIRMPVLDGLGLIKLLAEEHSQIRVIILSAYQDFSYAKKAIQLGVEDYLLKPIDELELEQVLLKIIKELDSEEKQITAPVLDLAHWNRAGFTGSKFLFTAFWLPGFMRSPGGNWLSGVYTR